MPDARIIKKNGDFETEKVFPGGSAPYEHLKPGDIVDVEEADGSIADYYVTDMKWDFTHFGDTLTLKIESMKREPTIRPISIDGKMGMNYWISP